mgnify:CR=1 FL=1
MNVNIHYLPNDFWMRYSFYCICGIMIVKTVPVPSVEKAEILPL